MLIGDLLVYYRLSSQQESAYQLVDLNGLLSETKTDLEATTAEKEAFLGIGRIPTTTGNLLQLRQVFQSLLSNGLKFTKPGHIVPTAQMPFSVSLRE